jgi:hypothetical protein
MRLFGERVRLVTETVDGLHRVAQSSLLHTCEVHGFVGAMRCARGCFGLSHVPRLPPHPHGVGELSQEERAALVCVRCGGPTRPHVLWLDEKYDEPNYCADTALHAAANASALIVAGSAGVAALTRQIVERVVRRRVPIIVITSELNDLATLAARQPRGIHLRGVAAELVPVVVEELAKAAGVSEPAGGDATRRRRSTAAPERILEVGAEGGCMTLQGRQEEDGRWLFQVNVDASTLAELMPEEFTASELRRDGEWVYDFERALQDLDRSACWELLVPMRVHPEFSDRILEAVRSRLSSSCASRDLRSRLGRWQAVCAARRPW